MFSLPHFKWESVRHIPLFVYFVWFVWAFVRRRKVDSTKFPWFLRRSMFLNKELDDCFSKRWIRMINGRSVLFSFSQQMFIFEVERSGEKRDDDEEFVISVFHQFIYRYFINSSNM